MQKLEKKWDSLRSWNRNNGRINPKERRHGWKYHHVKGVGGSTLHFTGEAHQLNPRAMRMQTRFGVAADWPFNYSELEPYYEIAERIIGVAGPAKDRVRPRSKPCPLPPHPLSYASNRVAEDTRKLGLNWVPNNLAVLSAPYDGRPPCNYCGGCNRGCPRTDKGSVDVTFMRKALSTGRCTLLAESPVVAINPGRNDLVNSVEYLDATGTRHKITTPQLILACGAVETPRLLLLARNDKAPDGLANESGHVGRHFMETLSFAVSGLHSEPLGSYRGLPSDMVCWDYNAPDAIPGIIGGCRFSPSTAESMLNGPVEHARVAVEGWGLEHKRKVRETFGRAFTISAIGESLPNDQTHIDIDWSNVDHMGLAVARINSYLDEMALQRLSFMADKCREIIDACGIDEVFEEHGSYDFFSSTHVFGSCRMGQDPSQSVVNPDCRSHKWKNLYIVDGSVFPSTGGGESPALTIEAVAIRAASKLRDRLVRRER